VIYMEKKRFFEYDNKHEREAVAVTVILVFATVWITEAIIAFLIVNG